MATTWARCQVFGLVLLCVRVWELESRTARLSPEEDVLKPYNHSPSPSPRPVGGCPHVSRGSYETWPSRRYDALPLAAASVFISEIPGSRPRWVHGHMMFVHDPLRTVSVVEPGGLGGCRKDHRVTVQQTARAAGCLHALNAGFFHPSTDGCLGNIVSDGRLVMDSRGVQNAQFGIRRDGSLVFGYLSQEDVLDQSNPFEQLVSGVVWLLRNGEVYINQSLKAECHKFVQREVFRDFVDALSARTVVGHDARGSVVLFHVDGETNERGMTLWEVAEFLKKHGVVNAINLDGGGSSSLVINGTLASYPPDKCTSDSRWRCARPVSTILCVRAWRCQPENCSGHGDCVDGRCRCQEGWTGDACDCLDCKPHSVCAAECPPGFYGPSCAERCRCDDQRPCDPLTGACGPSTDSSVNRDQDWTKQLILLWKQKEEESGDSSYLTGSLLIFLLTLTLFLLVRPAVHVLRARRRWFLCSYSYFHKPLRNFNGATLHCAPQTL